MHTEKDVEPVRDDARAASNRKQRARSARFPGSILMPWWASSAYFKCHGYAERFWFSVERYCALNVWRNVRTSQSANEEGTMKGTTTVGQEWRECVSFWDGSQLRGTSSWLSRSERISTIFACLRISSCPVIPCDSRIGIFDPTLIRISSPRVNFESGNALQVKRSSNVFAE